MNGLDPAGILEMRRLIRAFVDEGRVIVQGAVGEIAARGEPTVLVEVDDVSGARQVLAGRGRALHPRPW